MISSWVRRFGLLSARGRGRALVLLVLVGGALGLVPGAAARKSGSETITTTLVFPINQIPSKSGVVVPFSGGTFSASGTVADSGTVAGQAWLGGAPSPVTGVLQTVRTYSSSDGNGTLTLRCNERFSPPGQTANPATIAGSCVVHNATGAYAGLKGSGRLTGTSTFGATAITNQETLVLGGQ